MLKCSWGTQWGNLLDRLGNTLSQHLLNKRKLKRHRNEFSSRRDRTGEIMSWSFSYPSEITLTPCGMYQTQTFSISWCLLIPFLFSLSQLEGANEPVILQVFVGSDTGRVKPHGFYQACRVTGRNTTTCKEVDIDGTTVIEVSLDPSTNMTLAYVLFLRKRSGSFCDDFLKY